MFYKNYESIVKTVCGSDLFCYYPIGEQSGSNCADEGPNGYDGTYSGVTLNNISSPNGTAGTLFDGANDYVQLPSGMYNNFPVSQGTAGMWLRYASGALTDGQYRFAFTANGSGVTEYVIFGEGPDDDTIFFAYAANNKEYKYVHSFSTEEVWYSHIMTWKDTDPERYTKAYVNGEFVGQTAIARTNQAAYDNARISENSSSIALDGHGAHAFVCNRVLTATEISTLGRI